MILILVGVYCLTFFQYFAPRFVLFHRLLLNLTLPPPIPAGTAVLSFLLLQLKKLSSKLVELSSECPLVSPPQPLLPLAFPFHLCHTLTPLASILLSQTLIDLLFLLLLSLPQPLLPLQHPLVVLSIADRLPTPDFTLTTSKIKLFVTMTN